MPNNENAMVEGGRVQSLERGLAILEQVARRPEGVGVRELAGDLGLKAPTVQGLVNTLAACGYLAREVQPVRYRLGPALAALSGPGRVPLARRAEAELLALGRRWPRAVLTLSEGSARGVVTVLRLSPAEAGRVTRPAAQVLSAYGSASALLFQALWSEEQRAAFELEHPFYDQAQPLWPEPAALERFLAEVRAARVAVTSFDGEGLIKVAAPIWAQSHLAAALGGAAPREGLGLEQREALVTELRSAAARLSGEAAC